MSDFLFHREFDLVAGIKNNLTEGLYGWSYRAINIVSRLFHNQYYAFLSINFELWEKKCAC